MAKRKEKPETDENGDTESTSAEHEAAAPDAAAEESTISIEDLVPGLEDEVAKQEADDQAAQIASLTAERDALKDKWTRALAETENVRKRAERDRADAETYGGTRLARDLLPVYDSLDRALKAADDDLRERAKSFFEGIELTRRELLNAFAKHKIEPVTPEPGARFDPNRHQAMFQAPIPGAEPGTVIEVMQSGFVIADRLLRPALVGVAKAPEASTPEAEPPEDEAAAEPEHEAGSDDAQTGS